MKQYSLPFDINTADHEEEMSIDMSSLNFDVPEDKQKRSAFVFLRNTGVKGVLDFSNCSYKDKEEYLRLFMEEDIDVNSDILCTTWIEILSAKDGGGVILPSILSGDEIQKFIDNNKDLLDKMYQLINSLPIYSMYCSPANGDVYNVDDFPKTDDHQVKITNFSKLSKYDPFALLIDGTTRGKFYTKIFIKNEPHIAQMMDRLPFLNLLTALFAPPEIHNEILHRVDQKLQPPEVRSPNERKEETNHGC